MKRLHLTGLLAAILGLLPLSLGAEEPLALSALQRALHPEKPALEKFGALRSLGVLELSSGDPRFGGFSGLTVSPDGERLEAVSDQGHWIAARILYDSTGRLAGLDRGRIAPLVGLDGAPLGYKRRQDAESLAVQGDGLMVSFEHEHRIWRYAKVDGRAPKDPEALPPPPGLASLPANDGLEALAWLDGQGLLAIASKSDGAERYPAFLRQDDAWQRLWYRRTAPYEPTGATVLPDGDLIVVERRFSLLGGLGIRLLRIARDSVAPGAVLEGAVLAELTLPLTIDNLEGVASRQGASGETLIYLISDDNFNALQRNLLLLFALEG